MNDPDERLREAVIAEVVRWLREKADGTGTAQNAWAAGFAAEIIEGELAAADRDKEARDV